MLHGTTEIGKPGKNERERKHFPDMHNKPGIIHPDKAQGRRYIPHKREGREEEWKPHNQYIDIKYSDSGPDWSSNLRYIPAPSNLNYPATEIWPDNWKAMRPYPFTYRRSEKEWLLDPKLTKLGLRCYFNGIHKASAISESDMPHTLMFGHGRHENSIDKRNYIAEASPGDKSYQVPEYSPSFYSTPPGFTLPKFRTGNSPYMARPKKKAETFIPLFSFPPIKKETFKQKMEKHQKLEEVAQVRQLETWRPAKDISLMIPQSDQSVIKSYQSYFL